VGLFCRLKLDLHQHEVGGLSAGTGIEAGTKDNPKVIPSGCLNQLAGSSPFERLLLMFLKLQTNASLEPLSLSTTATGSTDARFASPVPTFAPASQYRLTVAKLAQRNTGCHNG